MAQLDNAVDSDSKDQGFESLRAGQKKDILTFENIFFYYIDREEGVTHFLFSALRLLVGLLQQHS